MRFIVQVRIEPDTDTIGNVIDIAVIERDVLSPATLGLTIEEAKGLLAGVQTVVATEHCADALSSVEDCGECGRRFAHKDTRHLQVRTLYGMVTVSSPRWWTCICTTEKRAAFTPLAKLLPERFTPELGLVEAKLAAHMAFSAAGALLGELLPVGRVVHGNETRRHVHRIGARLDAELDTENEYAHMNGSGHALRALPKPDMPLVVSIDGGYVHSSAQTSRRDGWFQAVCGTVTRHDVQVRRFGFVPNVDTRPRRRIRDTLIAQGLQANQLVTFLSDGATDLAGWTDRMNPTAEYVLDWFHIAMRFTVLANTMHGLQTCPEFDDDPADIVRLEVELRRDIGRAKWHVWHGNIHDALELLSYTTFGLEGCANNDAQVKAVKLVDELYRYLERNQGSIPSYAERHRAGEPISSATAEATVNSVIAKRMVKKQQMRWTPTGAHHLLQIRTRVLDGQLDHDINRWNQRAAAA